MIKKKASGSTINFVKYVITGFIWAFLNVFLIWFFIDVAELSGLIGSTIVVIIILLGKYATYLFIGLIKPHFFKYLSTAIVFPVLNVFLIWLTIDIMGAPTVITSAIVAVLLFVLKFIAFNMLGLIKEPEDLYTRKDLVEV